jgi:hypothetical protein
VGYGGIFGPEFEPSIGSFLGVRLPEQVPMGERYSFNWNDLRDQANPFAKFDYDQA